MLQEMENKKELLRREVMKFVTNKDLSLDARWSLFIESGLGYERGSIEHWETLAKYVKYESKYHSNNVDRDYVNNGDYASRHENIYVDGIYERLLECVEEAEELAGGYSDEEIESEEFFEDTIYEYTDEKGIPFGMHAIDEWREEVLRKFIMIYEFDW